MKTLFEAIESTDAGAVWKLVQEGGAAMDAVDETTGLTPLAIAAEAGLAEIVRTLLEAGADPNLGGATTPLEAAVVEGHLDVVEALLEKSADVNQKVEEGFTPLMTAAATGNLPLVRMLLAAGARPRLLNDDRQSAITLAENAGHDDVVEELKETARRQRAVDLEARQKKQAEVLEEAESTAAESTAAESTAAESTAAESTAAESTAAESTAAESTAAESTAAENREAEDPAGGEAETGDLPEPISILVDAESPVGGSTELFAPIDDSAAASLATGEIDEAAGDELFALPAGFHEEDSVIDTDESLGAEPDEPRQVVDDFSVSLGEFEGLLARFKELADADSRPELQKLVAENLDFADSAGRTLLMAAAYQGEAELVQALIDAGADVNAYDRTGSGQTVLVYAVQSPAAERLEVVSKLVAAGADVNQRCGRNRRSALMYAVDSDVYLDRPPESAFAQTTKELIRLGANLEARDRHGRTVWRLVKRDAIGAPTFSACRRRLHQMLRVLEYNGAQQIASHKM